MIHTYKITGMTCSGCEKKITGLLSAIAAVKEVNIDLAKGTAAIEMDKHIPTATLKAALQDFPAYQLSEASVETPVFSKDFQEEEKSWLGTYKPILIIFAYVASISLIAGFSGGGFDLLHTMRIFMAGFFISFSFFKMLDLEGFADSYSMYDIIAKKFKQWSYVYAFIELGLGLAYSADFLPGVINYVTLIVMSVSIIGVLQTVLNKRKIRCACLGAVFNLPMSTVTIIEDSLMIAMSVAMIAAMP